MAFVGLEKLYYAILTKDDEASLTYETPVYLPGVKAIQVNPSAATEKLYAENMVWEQETALEEIQVTVNVADLSNKDSAILLGQTVATEGGVYASEDDEAPYVALLYKANKTNKQARYQVLYKGKFSISEENKEGKEGSVNFQTPSINAVFQTTKNDGNWKYQVDTDDEDCPVDIDTSFFAEVTIPTKKIEA